MFFHVFSVSFLNVWVRISVRTWPLSTRRPHLCPLRTHRTTHRWPKFRLPHSSLQWWYGIPDGFKTCQTSVQPIQSREAEQAESRCCQKAVFFVNRSISDILQENWKRVVLFSPRLRLGLGRPFDIFWEIVITFWVLTCAVRTHLRVFLIKYTSRAARGGGGSFKNRKCIGEIGCCESRMTKRKHWWIWLTAELSNWLTD